jgi:glucose/arabinose dehydrogenase
MKRIGIVATIGIMVLGTAAFAWKNLSGIGPTVKPPSGDIAHTIEVGGAPLTLPANFTIEVIAKNLPGARVLARDSFGSFWVSRTNEGVVTLLEVDRETGQVVRQNDMLRELNHPHGLLFGTSEQFGALYVAEEDAILRVHTYSDGPLERIVKLPASGGHYTRSLAWLPGFENEKMLVSIGSSCNVCTEEDPRRGTVMLLDMKTRELEPYARGLRNSVFMATHPVTGAVWATEMGRDLLGDDIPPDEINIISNPPLDAPGQSFSVRNFGWPTCYGKNIHDTDFDKKTYIRNPCMEPFETGSYIDVPAHSAPLGIAFIPEEGWPEEYWHNLLVAYHGSWNRSVPTGYKVVRVKLDAKGKYLGTEDFITGWLTENGALGRPVDIKTEPGGIVYLTDDKAGVIYKLKLVSQSS